MFKERIKKLYLYRHTLWDMSISQLKAKYRGSILGIFWAFINPVLIMLVIVFVFTSIFKIEIKNFALFILSGIFPWMFFSSALSDATFSIKSQQNILQQFNLPREILPLSSILSNFLNSLIGWFVIYPLFLLFNPKIFFMLPLLVMLIFFNLLFVAGLGMVMSILNIFYQDIGHLLGVLLMLWMWITPVFYSIDMVPAAYRWVCDFNPMSPYISGYREIIFAGNIPGIAISVPVIIWAFISIILGYYIFTRFEPKILKRI